MIDPLSTPNAGGPFGYGPITAQFVTRGAYSPPAGRPVPTAEDKAEAEAIVAAWYDRPRYCPIWVARHRAELVESAARDVQQQRLVAEHRAAVAAPKMGRAA